MPPRFKRPPPPPADTADRAEDDEDDFFSRNKKGWSGVKTERISERHFILHVRAVFD